MRRARIGLGVLALLAGAPREAPAVEPVRVLVAASFRDCVTVLADTFSARTGAAVVVSSGSTGGLYAQIRAGAPCHLFFAADTARPRRLVADGWAAAAPVYATGELVLCTRTADAPAPTPSAGVASVLADLLRVPGARLAVPNPDLAPYGAAARQTLAALGMTHAWRDRLVTGQDVGQTWQFFRTGAMPAAFVARSQLVSLARHDPGTQPPRVIAVPAGLHEPLLQALAVRRDAPPAAVAFRDFVLGPEGAVIIRAGGFGPAPAP